MSRFPPHGQTGGGGVRRPGGGPPPNQPRSSGQGYRGGGHRDQPADKVSNHWPNYLEGGYFDDAGNLRIQYVSRVLPGDEHLPDPQQHGVEPLVRAMADGQPRLTTGQLRRFFQHCRAIETRLKTGQSSWAAERRHVEFLDAAAQDAYGKRERKIPSLFLDFISRNVHAIKTEKDFREGFMAHFEALVGFGSGKLQERN